MNLSDFICVYDNVLTDEECNAIIAAVEDRSNMMYLHDTPLYTFYQMDLMHTDLLPIGQSFATIAAQYANHYFRTLGFDKFVGVQGFEDVRVKKYLRGSDYEFREHIDVIGKSSAMRYLTFIVYLNDNNGDTTFDKLGLAVKPKRGSMVVFPPMWMFPHAGTCPTDADKYIMMTSLHYTEA